MLRQEAHQAREAVTESLHRSGLYLREAFRPDRLIHNKKAFLALGAVAAGGAGLLVLHHYTARDDATDGAPAATVHVPVRGRTGRAVSAVVDRIFRASLHFLTTALAGGLFASQASREAHLDDSRYADAQDFL